MFEDPLALRIIEREMADRIRSGKVTRQQRLSPSFRAYMAVRSRYTEDQLAHAVHHGVRQYVVLGAGLDTFGYRNPYEGVRVFEVDHPATQQWKRVRLASGEIPIPDTVTFVSSDFEHRTLGEALADAGFRSDWPAFFSWLGVTPYLTEAAFHETLSYIARMPDRSGVVLDYAIPSSVLNEIENLALDALSARVARVGEPFQLFFTPEQMTLRLLRMGFVEIQDLGRDEMNQMYFSGQSGRFRVRGNLARLLCAWV